MTNETIGEGRELEEAQAERGRNPNPAENEFEAGWNAALREASAQIARRRYWRKDKPGQVMFDYMQSDAAMILSMLLPPST